MKQVQHTED